ncbi:MAG: Fic family protein [Planctomycetes bacterium]|nr:Fic family protein [Planctomycetota bacterium]
MRPRHERFPAGYQALIERFQIRCLPLAHTSYVRRQAGVRVESTRTRAETTFPLRYQPQPDVPSQLEFALKYDGVNLEVLAAVFEQADPNALAAWVRSTPTGKYARRIWFLFEWLTGRTLDVPDAEPVAYVNALGDSAFAAIPRASLRHRVRDDLPGTRDFCPLVRRTETLLGFGARRLDQRVRAIVEPHDAALLHRVAQFLYLKETKSSFEIEREHPDRQRTLRFVELLRSPHTIHDLSVQRLVELQQAILDPRYAKNGLRTEQNYVGQTLASYRERIHYVSPKPADLPMLMNGWLQCSERLAASRIDPVVQAAALGFGFVYLHPFDDGNGRLHRYLIHHVLSRTGFTPPDLVLPVSAAMLARPRDYDACLEQFSVPLLALLDYRLDANGAMTVLSDSARHYRYLDATAAAEYLYATVEQAIEEDLRGEIDYLTRFDAAWRALREIVDMPDRRLELFVRLCVGNGGRLSATKRPQFAELTDEEIARMEAALLAAGL